MPARSKFPLPLKLAARPLHIDDPCAPGLQRTASRATWVDRRATKRLSELYLQPLSGTAGLSKPLQLLPTAAGFRPSARDVRITVSDNR